MAPTIPIRGIIPHRAGEGCGDRLQQDVAVLDDVADLVREHAFELVTVDELQKAFGDEQTTALSCCWPEAKAFGCGCGAIATCGLGSPARWRSRSTMLWSSGASSRETMCAWYARSAALPELKYATKFMAAGEQQREYRPLLAADRAADRRRTAP